MKKILLLLTTLLMAAQCLAADVTVNFKKEPFSLVLKSGETMKVKKILIHGNEFIYTTTAGLMRFVDISDLADTPELKQMLTKALVAAEKKQQETSVLANACDLDNLVPRVIMSAELTTSKGRRCKFDLKAGHKSADCKAFNKSFKAFKKAAAEFGNCPDGEIEEWAKENKFYFQKLDRATGAAIRTARETKELAKVASE